MAGLFVCLLGATELSAGESVTDPMAALKIGRMGAGTDMPAFTLASLDGRPVSSADLKGKVVVLNFWATWCGPCKEEMPALDRLRREFDPARFVLLTITTDIRPRAITSFLKTLGLDLPVLLDDEKDVSGVYLVRGLPTTVLIGKDGRVVARAVGPRDWDSPEAVSLIRSLTEAAP